MNPQALPPPKAYHALGIAPKDQELVAAMLACLEEKFSIAELLPPDRVPLISDITPEIRSRTDLHLTQEKELIGRFQQLPSERFLIAMSFLLMSFVWTARHGEEPGYSIL